MIPSSNPLIQNNESKYQRFDKLPPLKPLQEASSPVAFKIPEVEESGAVVFQERDVIKIDSDFVNAEGQLLATIQGLAMKAGVCPDDKGLAASETENHPNEVLLIPTASDIIIYGQDSDSSRDLEQGKVIKSAGDITLISDNGTVWSKHGHIYAPDKKVIIQAKNLTLEDFDIIAREIEIQGELAQFTNVRFITKESLNLNLNKAEFEKVLLHAKEGPLMLTHENLGLYSNSTLFSEGNSIDCHSEGVLQFLNTESLAKKEIRQEAVDILNWESYHTAGEDLVQYAAGEINSYNTLLAAENSVSLDGESISSDALTVIANSSITADSVKQGRYVQGRFHASEKTTLTSQSRYLDLTKAEIDSKGIKAEAAQQVMMPEAKVQFGEKAEFISQEQQIEAQGSQIRTKAPENETNEVCFQALQGTIYLNENDTQPIKKVSVHGKYVELGNSSINSIKEAVIDAIRLEGKNSKVTSQTGNIKIKGDKSLLLDNVLKEASQGKITEESQQWISEKNNENISVEMVRSAAEMDLVNTMDTGKKVHLTALKRFNASGYAANPKESFTLDAKGVAKIEDSSVNAAKIKILAEDLWLHRNNFTFDQLQAQSRALNMHSSIAAGNTSSFTTLEGAASFYGNQFKARFNEIKVGKTLDFENNRAEGTQKISSEGNQRLVRNAFSQGDVHLKSTAGDTSVQYALFKDVNLLQVENPQGTASLNKVDSQAENLKIQSKNIDIQNSKIASNTALEGEKVQVAKSIIQSEQAVKINVNQAEVNKSDISGKTEVSLKSANTNIKDSTIQSSEGHVDVAFQTGTVEDSLIQAMKDVTVQGESLESRKSQFNSQSQTVKMEVGKQHLDQVQMQGVDVVQKGSEITNLNTVMRAQNSLTREADTLVAQGGVEEANIILEKAGAAVISERSSTANEKIEQQMDQALLHKNTLSASEIVQKGDNITGTQNQYEANTVKVEANQAILPKTTADVGKIEVKTKEEASLPLGNFKGIVSLENGKAPIDVGHGIIEGSLVAKSEGIVKGANLQIRNGQGLGVEANDIWMPGLDADSKTVVLNAQDQIDISKGNIIADELSASGNVLHAPGLEAKVKKDVSFQTKDTTDLTSAKLKIEGKFDSRSEHQLMDKSKISAHSITEVGRTSLSAQDSTQAATTDLKAAGKTLWMPGLHFEADKMGLHAVNHSNISQGDIKAGSFSASADTLNASEIKAKVTHDAQTQTTSVMNMEKANIEVGGALDTRGDYLFLDQSEVTAHSITEFGKNGISSAESTQKAQTELTQVSDNAIDVHGSDLQANKIHQQANGYMDHRGAVNKAASNVVLTSFYDNRKGTFQGDLQAKTKLFDNREGHFQLGNGVSSIETDHLFNNEQSQITGKGSLGILSHNYHPEQSQVQIDGTYQLKADRATLDSSIKAGGVLVDTGYSRPIDITERGNIQSEWASFVSSKLSNKGKMRSNILEVDQINFDGIGDAIGSKHLIYKVNSSILADGMTTPGSLTLQSRQGQVDVSNLNIGNDLTLQGRNLHIAKNVHAAGRGILLTPGMCHFDHAKVFFGNGIDADAGTFYSQASDIDIVGQSKPNTIRSQNFRLEGEREIPPYGNLPHAYRYTPSNFRLKGDLYFNAAQADNIGSNFLVDGNGYMAGSFNNVNVDHEYSQTVETGKCRTGKWWRRKKKTLHKTIHKTVVDGYANTQFSKTLNVDWSTHNNTGVLLAGNMYGKVNHLNVGIPSNKGQIDPLNLDFLPRLPGLPIPRAGGDLQARQELKLDIETLNNTGFIEADVMALKVKGLFHNRKRFAEEREDAIGKRRHHKVRIQNVITDHVQPGGEIRARVLHLDAAKGKNQGIIMGRDEYKGSGGDFDNEALPLRSVNPANHRAKNGFVRAQLLSGNVMDLNYTGRFKNEASDVISWGKMDLTAGEIVERTRFAVNVEQDKKGWKKRSLLHSIDMEEGKIWSIQGPLHAKSTKGNIDIEGEIGSFEGHVKLESAQDYLFRARTQSVNNRISGWKASFGKVGWQQTDFNTTKTSLPHVFAGDGLEFINGRNLIAEGLQLDVKGDLEGNPKKSVFKGHKVEHYVNKKGFGMGVQAFGVQAVQAALNHDKPKDIGSALLREDPAVDSVFKLAASRDGVDAVKNGVGSAVKLWNEGSAFAGAYNQGNLGNALGEHFGITDAEGHFKPRVGLYAEFTKENRKWTTTAPSRLNIDGNWKWHVPDQVYTGAEINVTENAELVGDNIIGEADSDTFSMKSKGIKPSVSFGPSGFGAGVEYQQGSANQQVYSNFKLNVGKKLDMKFDKSMQFSGAEIEADEVYVQKTPLFKLESKQDKSSQSHFKAGISTDGNGSLAFGHESSSQVGSVSFIKARKKGLIEANYMQLIGANTQNIKVEAGHLQTQDIVDVKKGSSFSAEFTPPKKSQEKSQGLNLMGAVDYKAHHEEVKIKPIIAGGNGDALGVSTDLSKQREVIKDKKIHIGAPIVAINSEMLRQEVQEMRKAFHLDPIAKPKEKEQIAPEAQASEEDNLPATPKVKKEKKASAKKVKKQASEKKAVSEDSKPVVEAPKQAVSIPAKDVPKDQKEVKGAGVKKSRADEIIEFALLAKEREDTMNDMGDLRISTAIPEIIIEKACGVHPKVQKVCAKAGIVVNAISDFVKDNILPHEPHELENRKRNIHQDALNKKERLNIPMEATYQWHKDMENRVVASIIALPVMAVGLKGPAPKGKAKFPAVPLAANSNINQKVHFLPANSNEFLNNGIKKPLYATDVFLGQASGDITRAAHVINKMDRGSIKAFLRDESGSVPLPQKKSRNSRDIIKVLEGLGYEKVPGAGKGSHRKYTKEGFPMAIIPDEKELAKGTAQSLWKTIDKAKSIFDSKAPIEMAAPPKASNYQLKPHRIDYSKEYKEAAKEFVRPPKEFSGTLQKDLVLVNYHSDSPLSANRSCSWATVPAEANNLRTMEAVKDQLALLNSWGDRSHVSVARIPAGEQVRFLHGRAGQKMDPLTHEARPGGGVQYRFFDFDPKWIVETRPLPEAAEKGIKKIK